MKNLRTTSLWCATLIAFVALNVACHHHETAQNSKGGSHKTLFCTPGEAIRISDVGGGVCAVSCDQAFVTRGTPAIFQAANSEKAFDVVFPLLPKATHDPNCEPGAGNVLQSPKVPVPVGGHPAPSGPTQQKGCYEYTIYPHGINVACNDPNIVVY